MYDFVLLMGRYGWLMRGSLYQWRLKPPCPPAGYTGLMYTMHVYVEAHS